VTARARQRGAVALMFAMLIVALCTLFAVSLAWDTTLDVRRTTNLLWREQAAQVGLGAEEWVGTILRQDARDNDTDHLGEIWAQQLPPLPVDGAGMSGEIAGGLVDLQGRFNINNLLNADGAIDEASLEQFRRLLLVLGLQPSLAGAVADWLDADTEPFFPDGAEERFCYYDGLAYSRDALIGVDVPSRRQGALVTEKTLLRCMLDRDTATLIWERVETDPQATGWNQ